MDESTAAHRTLRGSRAFRRLEISLGGLWVLGGAVASTMLLSSCVGPPANELARDWGWIDSGEAACPVEVDESITTSARMGWQAIPNGDVIVRQLGWLEACMPNADISWQKYDGGADVIQGFESDSVDIVVSGSAGPARGLSKPINMDAVVPYVFDVIGGAEQLVARDESIKTLRDLKGKKVAVPASSTTHYSLLSALEQEGMSGADVRLVFLTPDKIAAGWQTGELDAAYAWDPVRSQILETGHTVVTSSEVAEGGAPTFDVAVASRSFVAREKNYMDMWARLQDEATRMINEEPAKAAEVSAEGLGIDAAMVEEQYGGYEYPSYQEQVEAGLLGDKLSDALYDTAVFLKEQGEVAGVNEREFYRKVPVQVR